MKSLLKFCSITVILTSSIACKKFVDIAPPATRLVGSSVYTTDPTAAAAVTGIYQSMINLGNPIGGGGQGISALLGLSADEFKLFPTDDPLYNRVYTNAILSNTNIRFWDRIYNCIYQANAAIEGLSISTAVSPSLKQQLIGEALFIRSFCYFYLVNIYGDVPLILSTSYDKNKLAKRNDQEKVFQQILSDLEQAEGVLSEDYVKWDGTLSTDRVRPNKYSANAMLARVQLYLKNWSNAEAEASKVINNNKYQLQDDLNNVFIKDNGEAIWQLESPNTGFNAPDAEFLTGYLYYGGPVSFAPFLLNDSLINSFETNDLRKTNWIVKSGNYYFPYKYKLYYTGTPPTEYPTLLRLAEQYLIRAEARAELNNLKGAITDLNTIRSRSGLSNTSALTKTDVLDAIYSERWHELFTEYGHRWLDLKRLNKVDEVMYGATVLKGGAWEPTDKLYPIPLLELQADPNLMQNPGY